MSCSNEQNEVICLKENWNGNKKKESEILTVVD